MISKTKKELERELEIMRSEIEKLNRANEKLKTQDAETYIDKQGIRRKLGWRDKGHMGRNF